MQIAETILKQLTCGVKNRVRVMSWGARGFKAALNENFLIFRVTGRKFIGRVKITLNEGLDVYEVEFIKGRNSETIKKIDMVYCDNLTEVIDDYIERQDNYSF